MIRRYLRPKIEYDKIAMASCDQCNFCTELCPRYLLGHPIEPHKNMRNSGFAATDWDLVAGAEFAVSAIYVVSTPVLRILIQRIYLQT